MADNNTTTTEEEKRQEQYASPYESPLQDIWYEMEQQQKDDEERIEKLSKGRAYWVGANMFANALGNLINVYGTTHGAPAMKMPDMDNGYMKQWKESDDLRKANYQRMKDRYDRLRLAKIQDESRHNDILEGRKYAEQQRKITEDKAEKELQDRIVALKTQYPDINISDEQWRMWAKYDKFMPDEVRKSKEDETFKTKIAQQRELNQLTSDKEAAEIRRIKGLYPDEANVTDDEAWAIYKGHGYSPRLHKWLTDNGYQTQSFNKRKGTVSFGGTKKGEEHNIYIGDYVIKGSNKNQYSSNLGKLRSAVLKAIQRTEYYKGLSEYDKKRGDYTQANAMKWNDDDLSQYIEYLDLLNDPEFVKTIKGMAGNDTGVQNETGNSNQQANERSSRSIFG